MSEGMMRWLDQRGAGMLLHPTSLPGEQGIGSLGADAHRFLDFLQASGMTYWQICPLGPTGYGDSPYQCFSAFAGNPYLIDLKDMAERGFLTDSELEPLRRLPSDRVDYGALWGSFWIELSKAHDRFVAAGRPDWNGESYEEFQERNRHWLDSYVLFTALKQLHGGKARTEWPAEHSSYEKALEQKGLLKELTPVCDAHRFYQYVFFQQWGALRHQAAARRIHIIGDIPIFVASDSADVWAQPDLFDLDRTGRPRNVAGVPPDYFSADGQLWGNPLYLWPRHAETGFAWWKARLEASFALYDVLRIDHFRGFDEFWQVPAAAKTARGGQWVAGPGLEFFKEIHASFSHPKIIAEDLGLLTPSVTRLRDEAGLPGMAVFQFAFGGKADNLYLPHNLHTNSVVYAGTHDNDTTKGWYAAADEKTKDHARRYLRISGNDIAWDFIRAAYGSAARLAIVTLQDVMNLGTQARLNTPGKPAGNWGWRFKREQLDRLFGGTATSLKELTELYGRTNEREDAEANSTGS